MSHKLTNEAWKLRGIGRAERVVFVRLCDYVRHDAKNNTAWPSVASLAGDCGYSLRTVQYALARLRERGLIRAVSDLKCGRGLTVMYEVIPEGLKGEIHDRKGAMTAPIEEGKGCSFRHERVQSTTRKGAVFDSTYNDEPERTGIEPEYHPLIPSAAVEAVVPEPVLEPVPEPVPDPVLAPDTASPPEPDLKTQPALAVVEQPPQLEAEFEALWRGWVPVRVSKGSKKDALKAFRVARKGASYEEIVSGCAKYLDHCHATGCWTSHVFRWLQKELWRDDYPAHGSGGRSGGPQPVLTSYERGLLAAGAYARRREAEGAYDADKWGNF